MSTAGQPFFEIRLYGKQGKDRDFRFSDEYQATYARYDAFSLVSDAVAEHVERVELRAMTPPNSHSLGRTVREVHDDPDADVEIISTGLYVIIVGPSLGFVQEAWEVWMEGVTRNLELPREIRARVSEY